MSKIVFAGDSITAAQYVTPPETFADIVGRGLGFDQIVNSGVSGQKAEQVLAGLHGQVLAHQPDACVLMIGTNNIAGTETSWAAVAGVIASYVSAVASIIDQVKAQCPILVLTVPFTKRVQETSRVIAINEALRRLCAEKSVPVIDVAARMEADARRWGSYSDWFVAPDADFYHLSATGHSRIADLILGSQISAPFSPPVIETGMVMNVLLPATFGNAGGQTLRCRVSASMLTPPGGDVGCVRLKLIGHADEPLQVNKMFIGPRSSGVAASYLVPVKVKRCTSFVVPAGNSIWTDWVQFPWDKTSDLIWSTHIASIATADKVAAASSVAGCATALKAGDEASFTSPSGFTEYAGYLSLVSEIQSDGF